MLPLIVAWLLFPCESRRIVGGVVSKDGVYPWLVVNKQQSCAGALIAPDFVITAGHCDTLHVGDDLFFNRFDLQAWEGRGEQIAIQEIIVYPDYNIKHTSDEHDLALVRLAHPALHTKPARLPTKREQLVLEQPGSMLRIAGWGAESIDSRPVAQMREVDVPVISNEVCADVAHYGTFAPPHLPKQVFSTMLCAGWEQGGKDACVGDSGAPLFAMLDDEAVLVGVTSWAVGCARAMRPGVYTRLSSYLDWIEGVIGSSRSAPSSSLACTLPIDPGPCTNWVRRLAFDGAECTSFFYSGCGGNLNNFETLEQCQSECPSASNLFAPEAQPMRPQTSAQEQRQPSVPAPQTPPQTQVPTTQQQQQQQPQPQQTSLPSSSRLSRMPEVQTISQNDNNNNDNDNTKNTKKNNNTKPNSDSAGKPRVKRRRPKRYQQQQQPQPKAQSQTQTQQQQQQQLEAQRQAEQERLRQELLSQLWQQAQRDSFQQDPSSDLSTLGASTSPFLLPYPPQNTQYLSEQHQRVDVPQRASPGGTRVTGGEGYAEISDPSVSPLQSAYGTTSTFSSSTTFDRNNAGWWPSVGTPGLSSGQASASTVRATLGATQNSVAPHVAPDLWLAARNRLQHTSFTP